MSYLIWFLPVTSHGADPAETRFERSAFDGQSLDGWRAVGCRAGVEDGNLVIQEGDGLLVSEHRYRDFDFQWQCRARRQENWDSGIYFRCELPPQGRPWPDRYQINLKQGDEGNLIGVPQARSDGLVRSGQWNQYLLQVRGAKAMLEINGHPAWQTDAIQSAEGHLAIQVETDGGGQFEFRKLRITEVGYRALFDGRDLAGWEGAGSDADRCWQVENEMLVCTGQPGPWLRGLEQFDNFNLRLEYRLTPGGNSGVYVRVPADGDHHGAGAGIEIQILDDSAERYKNLQPYQFSGSLYAIAAAQPRVTRDAGRWNTLEIDCQGTTYRVIQNGQTVVDATDSEFPELKDRLTKGYLGLQNHREHVWFRNIRIGPSFR